MSGFWRQPIPWYPDGCFGPYRSSSEGYSRRELLADGVVHAVGIIFGSTAVVALAIGIFQHQPPVELALGLLVYGCSLLSMLCASAAFNVFAWTEHLWALQLADHAGILLLIAGSYTPPMLLCCCPWTLGWVWAVGAASFTAKCTRSPLDLVGFHVVCFLLMGWAALFVWSELTQILSAWAFDRCVLGGLLYTVGLLPWWLNRFEFHNALWHVFVLLGSLCFFVVQRHEILLSESWGLTTCR